MIDLGTIQDVYTVGKTIYDIIQRIKDAPKAIQELGREVTRVQGILGEVTHELEERGDRDTREWSTAPFETLVEDAKQLTEDANKFLAKIDKRNKVTRAVEWIVYAESDAKILAEKFHVFCGSLVAVQETWHVKLS